MSDHSVLKFDYNLMSKNIKQTISFSSYDQLIDYLNINWGEMLEYPNKTVNENWEDFKSVLLLKGMNNNYVIMFISKGKKIPHKMEEKLPYIQQRAPGANP